MPRYYGWYIVAIGALILMLVVGSTINAFGLFILPVSTEFGLSRASMNTAIILLNFGMALSSVFVGRMLDTRSIRAVMAVSAVLLGGSLVALGLSTHIGLSAAILFLPLALGVVGAGTISSTALVARWFTIRRARAMAMAALGYSMGAILMAPLVGLLLDSVGWRQSLFILGTGITCFLLLLLPYVREAPGPSDVEIAGQAPPCANNDGPPASGGAVTLKLGQLLRIPQFWTINLAAAVTFGVLQAILVSIVPLAQERGLTVAQSASLLSAAGGAALLGKVILAAWGDRLERVTLLSVLFLAVALVRSGLILGDGYPSLLACAFFLGLAAGATSPAFLALIADRFGAASFGTANGAATFVMAISGAACLRFAGEAYDYTGSYDLMFLTFTCLGIVSAMVMFATRSLKPVGAAPEAQTAPA